ncbi:MAG TPA: nucleotide exchange factor GrpE [Gammaproteobacteria bacterium]|nr:nucleotide exchange factor GrpE [Gammaproteobacteria bacterium]
MTQEAPEQHPADDVAGTTEPSDLETLREQLAEAQDRVLRIAAELDNARKRAARDVENARRYGLERLAQALLPVRDSLEAGVAAGSAADAETLLEGKRATLRLLDTALEQVGIAQIDPVGEPFDPTKHEAMTMQPSDSMEPNTVLMVVQKGYVIDDRLLRPARVIVSRAPEPEQAE